MATPISNDLLLKLLETWPVGRLATVGASGPHIVPMVFCVNGGALFSPVDGKAKSSTALQRLKNIAKNPRCSVLLDHYSEDWQQLWWVRLDGSAQIYRPNGSQLRELTDLLRHKYPQYGRTPVTREEPTFLRMEWDAIASWAQADFTHARFLVPPT